MPAHDRSPNGAPCWVELFTSDPDSAKAFYGGLLGWDAEEPNPELGGYANFTSGGVRVAGLMRNDGSQGAPDFWTTYLAVPDAAAAVDASTAAGAQLHVPVMPVAELGVMAAVTDPSGAFVGYWQPGTHEGYGRVAEVGAPCWHELHTRDYAAALGFYRTVHGWETKELSDTDELRYTQALADGEPFAGVMDGSAWLPEGVPSHWTVYFGVADADAACARAHDLGGTVLEQPIDTPYGRIATLTDPTGTPLRVVTA